MFKAIKISFKKAKIKQYMLFQITMPHKIRIIGLKLTKYSKVIVCKKKINLKKLL